mmetsp:Transcript_17626/g.26755  ORF Transcript_17626/g.26755 Transcript_17626/m.26755 type:complete len:88 (+) Transcript_17626:5019-5282(+)
MCRASSPSPPPIVRYINLAHPSAITKAQITAKEDDRLDAGEIATEEPFSIEVDKQEAVSNDRGTTMKKTIAHRISRGRRGGLGRYDP